MNDIAAPLVALLATLCAGLFAGAAGYITLVEHWARLQAGPAVALAQFRPGFPRARAIQASLATSGGILATIAWLTGAGASWLVVAGLLFAVVVFTLIRITPIYTQLLDPALTPESANTPLLLEHWGRLHRVRSILGLVAFCVALAACDASVLGTAPSALCTEVGAQCQLPTGPLGVCERTHCPDGATDPCYECVSQH